VEAVSVANNHSNDYLDQGRVDTVRTLSENDIIIAGENYVGSVEIKGIKVALLAYVTFQTGFNYKSAIERDIAYVNKSHDVVIVMMHWGQELDYEANGGDIELAHKMIDYGADLVVGSHPHVIQGIENYNGRYIVYSLGNCSFAGSSNPTNDDILLFQQKFKLTENGVVPSDARVIPCRVSSQEHKNDFMPTPFEGDEAIRVINRVLQFSQHLEYGLVELSTDWITDPYTREEYRLDKQQEEDSNGG
jgi:poly-gamma-glutamate synthesis protein (capsule biosynthesis protein)